MSKYFDALKSRFDEEMDSKGYTCESTDVYSNAPWALYRSEKETVMVQYSSADKRFYLFRGAADADRDQLDRAQAYYFDEASGDDERQAVSVAADFADTLTAPVKASRERINNVINGKKSDDDDSMDADFFINRIPAALPECRIPLLQHKEYYDRIIPLKFCEETVCAALADDLKNNRKDRLKAFCDLLTNAYKKGDLDVKSLIIQIILCSVRDEKSQKVLEGFLGEDTVKAWNHGKKYIGKEVKPERISMTKKLAAAAATGERLK